MNMLGFLFLVWRLCASRSRFISEWEMRCDALVQGIIIVDASVDGAGLCKMS